MQLIRRRLRRNDRGAIAIIFGLLLGPVLLGIGALVIDVGHLYADRRQQQNAADSSALAVAHDCALKLTSCIGILGQPGQTAQTYASGGSGVPGNSYAAGATSHVDDICGTAPGLLPCSGNQGPWDCTNNTPSLPYVQVRTQTGASTGDTLLPPVFSRALTGNSSDGGHATRACARADYGAPGKGLSSLAVTLSLCEWMNATSKGLQLGTPPPYNDANPAAANAKYEIAIYLHTVSNTKCPSGQAGSDLPGGFGWLEDTTGSCQTFIDISKPYADKTGIGVPKACNGALSTYASAANPQIVYLPVFKKAFNQGNNGTYTLAGFAAFVVTGYHLPGLTQTSWLTGQDYCSGSDKCLYGFFTQGLISNGDFGGEQLGASLVRLVG